MATNTGLLPPEFVSFASNEATAPFWKATAEHRLVIPRCTNCGTFRFPPAAFCYVCRHQEVEWVEHDGNGTLYSFTVIRHGVIPGLEDALPLVIGVPPEVVEIGMPVKVDWYDVDEGSVPCFRPRA